MVVTFHFFRAGMPSLLLFDCSLSSGRHAKGTAVTYAELLIATVSGWLESMKNVQPFEEIGLISFHSVAKRVMDLTTDHEGLKNAL